MDAKKYLESKGIYPTKMGALTTSHGYDICAKMMEEYAALNKSSDIDRIMISLRDETAMRILQAKCTAWDSNLPDDVKESVIANLASRFGEDITIEEGMAKAAYSAADALIRMRNES